MNIESIVESYVEKFGNPAKIEGTKRVEGKDFLREKIYVLLEETAQGIRMGIQEPAQDDFERGYNAAFKLSAAIVDSKK